MHEMASDPRSKYRAMTLRSQVRNECRGHSEVKSFFELLGKAMQSTGTTLRLCLLVLVIAAAAAIAHLY